MNKESKKKENRKRYLLHSAIRKEGYRLSTKDRTIYVHFSKAKELSENVNKLMTNFHYAVQTELA